MGLGVDLVQVSRVRESIATFGDTYLRRVFTEGEIAYATSGDPAGVASRLAARFAAKEATIKALDLAEVGVGWRDIEVVRSPNGAPSLVLHGAARAALRDRVLEVSLSHEADYATAVVLSKRREES